MIDFCNLQFTTAMEGGRLIHTGQPWMWYDDMQVNEFMYPLTLSVQRINKRIEHWDGKIYNPTVACGLLRSVDTFGYGTFSAKIQLPKGRNLWPSFWLVGSGHWPDNGEIDICEAWSNENGYWRLGGWRTTTNIHWEDHGHQQTGSKNLPFFFSLKRPSHNFIKYEVEWRPDIVTFRVNGKTIRTYGYDVAKHLHDKRMNVIFDLWTTGENFTCDTPMKIRNFEYKPLETL